MSTGREFQEAVEYLNSLTALGWKPGLERFGRLCGRLGDPQDRLRCIHVGGTNGKGSTTAMIASILSAAGFRVGAYYSPYVYDVRERVQVSGEMIDEESFARLIGIIKPHAAALAETELGHPTEFEVKTALGLLYFVEKAVDFAVLEVGLGGRLDATNIVTPLVSVITNVTLDHMDRLGPTIPKIAMEKAGIVKPGGHLVTAAGSEALAVIRRVCQERGSTLWHVRNKRDVRRKADGHVLWEKSSSVPACLSVEGVHRQYSGFRVGMAGEFQFVNAATAVAAVEALLEKGVNVPMEAVRSGIENAYLPGRLEVLRRDPTLLIDAAHNADAARNLARILETQFAYSRLILVMGMVEGHSIQDVVGVLAPLASLFYATAPNSFRAAPALAIAEAAKPYCPNVMVVEGVAEAIRQALESASGDDLVCVTGSFYTIGEVPR